MAEAQTLRFAGTPLVARPNSRRQNERGASPLRGARTYGLTASGPFARLTDTPGASGAPEAIRTRIPGTKEP